MEQILEALAWPVVVLVVAVVALLVLRPQLGALLGRIKRVGTGGIETFEPQPTQPTEEKKGVEEFLRSFDNPMLVESEELIRKDLKERDIENPLDREKTLVRALAATRMLLHFERVSGLIWASQVACLRQLNSRGDGVDVSEIRPMYDVAKSGYPGLYDNYSFERWWGFLRDFNLVLPTDSRLFITVAGQEFLKYLVSARKAGPSYG